LPDLKTTLTSRRVGRNSVGNRSRCENKNGERTINKGDHTYITHSTKTIFVTVTQIETRNGEGGIVLWFKIVIVTVTRSNQAPGDAIGAKRRKRKSVERPSIPKGGGGGEKRKGDRHGNWIIANLAGEKRCSE